MSPYDFTEVDDELAGYLSDSPLDPQPEYPEMKQGFDDTILVHNIPKVPRAKYEKLTKVITKLYSKVGALSPVGVFMPFDEEAGSTIGVCFVEYESADDAKKAIEVTQGYQLDKNHKFSVVSYTEAMELEDVPDMYEEPAPPDYKPPVDTDEWKYDGAFRDEFCIRHSNTMTEVYWNDGANGADPALDYDGAREKEAGVNWCDYYIQWSSKGSFMATLLPTKGVILWGGKGFQKIGRFPAPGVDVVVFSPQEKFLLTSNNDMRDPKAIKVFEIESGKLLRAFPLLPEGYKQAEGEPLPLFSFSPDDSYLARMGMDLVSIYNTTDMKLLDRRSLSTPGIKEFQWCPSGDNILAYWCPEVGNAPAHVDIVAIPSRKKLRQKNLFNVTGCNLIWHPDGEYLGVKVVRHTKSRKTLYNNIELFRLRETGVPVEMLEEKDAVKAFAWEPCGSKFAIVHAESPASTKTNVTFYDMKKIVETKTKKGKKIITTKTSVSELNKIETLEGKQCNLLFWSPRGGIVILASLGDQASGTLEFYDTVHKTLTIKEHYRCTEVTWDPSGRTVASTVVQPVGGGHYKFAMDNGYTLWSCQGKQLYAKSFESFYQFQWRPRETLLSDEKINEVVKNLKKYEKRFDKAGKERARALYLEQTKGKRRLRSIYRERVASLKDIYEQQRSAKISLNNGYDSENEDNYVEKYAEIETIINSKEEVIVTK